MLPLYYFSICQFIILVLINNILFWSILLSFFATFIVTILLFVLNFRLCYFYICLHAFTTSICLGQGWQHNKGGHDNKGLRILHTLHVHSPPPYIISIVLLLMEVLLWWSTPQVIHHTNKPVVGHHEGNNDSSNQ